MQNELSLRAINADDLTAVSAFGLSKAVVLRAMAQDMAWLIEQDGEVSGAATAMLADGTVFLDGLVGDKTARITLLDHAVRYARWSYAPALTLIKDAVTDGLVDQGFVGLDPARLPPELAKAAQGGKVLMKRL